MLSSWEDPATKLGNNKTASLGDIEAKIEYKSTMSHLEFWKWKSSETCFFFFFLTHLVAVESAVKTPFASLRPSSIWGHTVDCGVRPLTHGSSSRIPVPRTPLRNEARVTPDPQGRHWPPSPSGHTSPLVHLFFLGKLPDPLSGGPLLGNPS